MAVDFERSEVQWIVCLVELTTHHEYDTVNNARGKKLFMNSELVTGLESYFN